ncbi:MAG: GLUG motif-containing protein [Bacteroidia bacterium]
MKKSIILFFSTLLLLTSCTQKDEDLKITSITFDSTQVVIGVSESTTLTLKQTPANLPAPVLTWVSLSPDIATVDANGVVKGMSIGTAKIKVSIQSDQSINTTCNVVVKTRGTSDLPYLINTVQDLIQMRDRVNKDNANYGNKVYKLMTDLDFSNEANWIPIGTNTNNFTGIFNGNGKIIKNIKIGTVNTIVSNLNSSGLFGYISGGKVLNLNVDWYCLNTSSAAGGIAGNSDNSTLIDNCHTSGIISGSQYSGGIVGISIDTEIKNSSSVRETTTNLNSSDTYDGGIVAKASDTRINNCYSNGNLSAYNCGGIIGAASNGTTVNDCYSMGNISSLGGMYPAVGGIIGNGSNTIINHCYSIGTIKSNGGMSYAGGIAGNLTGEIYNSYSTGTINSDLYSGGIVGYVIGKIYNCYSIRGITSYSEGSSPHSGGIAGFSNGTICNCYSSGNISSTSTRRESYSMPCNAGGIAGFGSGIIINSIALNLTITTQGNTSYVNLSSKRIANIGSTTCNNNYALKTMILKNGSNTITDLSETKSNGIDITNEPYTLLNNFVNSNPTINNITLLKWKVETGINNGYPIFQ